MAVGRLYLMPARRARSGRLNELLNFGSFRTDRPIRVTTLDDLDRPMPAR